MNGGACAVLATLALVSFAPCAAGQPVDDKAAAEALYEQAHALDVHGRFLQACPKYAESLKLDPGIGVMLHLASCWEKAGKPASAWAEYREAEQVAGRANDGRAEVARKHADALEDHLFRLTIVVPPAEAHGLTLVRDGEAVGAAQWGAAVPVDPGPHTIVAMAPGKKRWEATITAAEQAGAMTLSVPLLADASSGTAFVPAPPPPPREQPRTPLWGPQRIAAVAVAAVGVVGVGIGTAYGVVTKAKLDQSNAAGCQANNQCPPAGAALRNDALSAGKVSTVAFGVGLAALVGGAVLWFTAPRASTPAVGVTVGPEYAGATLESAW